MIYDKYLILYNKLFLYNTIIVCKKEKKIVSDIMKM